MTKIVQFTNAEWDQKLLSRETRKPMKFGRNSADIVIFPGVRVEYHDDGGEMIVQEETQNQPRNKKTKRLKFSPASAQTSKQ